MNLIDLAREYKFLSYIGVTCPIEPDLSFRKTVRHHISYPTFVYDFFFYLLLIRGSVSILHKLFESCIHSSHILTFCTGKKCLQDARYFAYQLLPRFFHTTNTPLNQNQHKWPWNHLLQFLLC